MRILIFGAGVCGSVLGAFLAKGGVDVTMLARGQRYEEIKQNGIILVDYQTSEQTIVQVPVITEEEYDQNPVNFDFILAILGHHQVEEAFPILAKISPPAPIFFLGNNCSGPEDYIQGVGRERVLLGMANAGGVRENGIITYISPNFGKKIPLHLGEIDGKITPRLRSFQVMLKTAGIRVKFLPNVDNFLKNHVAGLLPIIEALYHENGDLTNLGKNKSIIKLAVQATKENFHALGALGIPGDSTKWIPSFFLVMLYSKFCRMHIAEIGLRGHAMSANGKEEMANLMKEFRKLIIQSQVPTPSFDKLSEGIGG
ncbi:MAG TPA: 2-dehydropantoate 2-reductase N-terminal domain-containing protein [Candidatus Lokiarchaeia archaeon]|nr:2-dehydropantoate 2-reductase N-terminal domain-containing protein [Candidatus Lokiarchaeia archaeon]